MRDGRDDTGRETHCTLCQSRIRDGEFRQDYVGNISLMRVQALIMFEGLVDRSIGG